VSGQYTSVLKNKTEVKEHTLIFTACHTCNALA